MFTWAVVMITAWLWNNACPVQSAQEEAELSRDRRGLINLAAIMFKCTGRSALDYNGYGCYCGFGGSGTPVDAVDKCCQVHDNCYSATKCRVPHLTCTRVKCVGCSCICLDPAGSCANQACQCDITFGKCLSTAVYNPAHRHYCPNATYTTGTTLGPFIDATEEGAEECMSTTTDAATTTTSTTEDYTTSSTTGEWTASSPSSIDVSTFGESTSLTPGADTTTESSTGATTPGLWTSSPADDVTTSSAAVTEFVTTT